MPIRRSAAAPPKEEAPSVKTPDTDAAAESSAPAEGKAKEKAAEKPAAQSEEEGVAEENGASTADGEEQPKETETPEEGGAEKSDDAEADQGKKKKKKKVKEVASKAEKDGDDKVKKMKMKIPAWATVSSNRVSTSSLSQSKAEDIIIEAIESCKERSGTSTITIMKFVSRKYPSLEMDKKTKNLYKRTMKRLVEKGAVKQLKGKGFSGSFVIGKKPAASVGPKETLGESLPLIMTRLCEPKEASYILIKKYLEQHFPQLLVEKRSDALKNFLQKSVERGDLEQITGKGASGTFQLKKGGNKGMRNRGVMEDAVLAAITAMNEPKTCSITVLKKFLMDKQKSANFAAHNLKRALQKCKMMGWMEQISGVGLSGSYMLSYPYYPSPAILFPDMVVKHKEKEEQKQRQKRRSSSSDEEESEEEESEEEEEAPPPKKRRPQPKARRNTPVKKPGRKPPPKPAKKPAPSPKKPAAKAKAKAAPRKPVKATPVKKAAPTRKPKSPVAKKLTSWGGKAKKEAAKAKPAARKSLRARK